MKSDGAVNQLARRLHETGGRTALVRGATAPPKPPETVAVEPAVAAALGVEGPRGSLSVTVGAASGRTVRRYVGTDPRAAADSAVELVCGRDPAAVWLCARERIAAWWSGGVADLLERRLSEAASGADAPLVVWSAESDGAVDDRYDVVLDP